MAVEVMDGLVDEVDKPEASSPSVTGSATKQDLTAGQVMAATKLPEDPDARRKEIQRRRDSIHR
eukprot:3280556-Lingulodinium_polyedra.AAC.1